MTQALARSERKTWLIRLCLIVGLASILLAGFLTYTLLTERAGRLRAAREQAVEEASEAARLTNEELGQLPPLAQNLAETLNSQPMARAELESRFAQLRRANPILSDIGVAEAVTEMPGYSVEVSSGPGWQEPSWHGSPPSTRR